MSQQQFRSAFNGYNREDVVHYLEYINSKHQSALRQLTSENEELRTQLDRQSQPVPQAPTQELAAMEDRIAELEAQLTDAREHCARLEAALAAATALPSQPQSTLSSTASEELEAYRRAERIEREARERAELVYFQANGVLSEATARVDGLAGNISEMADQVMSQLTQLQMAVSSSKQALQDASSIMSAIKPGRVAPAGQLVSLDL